DAYAASHRAVREMKETGELSKRVRVRSSQYFEQPHRTGPPASQTADSADAPGSNDSTTRRSPLAGIEMAEKIQKGQFKNGRFGSCKASMSGTVERGARCLTASRALNTLEPS